MTTANFFLGRAKRRKNKRLKNIAKAAGAVGAVGALGMGIAAAGGRSKAKGITSSIPKTLPPSKSPTPTSTKSSSGSTVPSSKAVQAGIAQQTKEIKQRLATTDKKIKNSGETNAKANAYRAKQADAKRLADKKARKTAKTRKRQEIITGKTADGRDATGQDFYYRSTKGREAEKIGNRRIRSSRKTYKGMQKARTPAEKKRNAALLRKKVDEMISLGVYNKKLKLSNFSRKRQLAKYL